METFCQYTPYDPSSKEHKASVTMAFIDQASRDIRKRLQRLEGLQDKSLRDLVQVAEKVYHNRDGPGIQFIYGHPRLSLPSVWARLSLQDRVQIHFLPEWTQLTGPKKRAQWVEERLI